MAKQFYGWKRQPYDARDLAFHIPRRVTRKLVPTDDISAGLGPQLDQGSLGSCGPNTADELIEFDQRLQNMPVISASRLFIYYTTRQLMGTVGQDSGVDNRTMLKALAQYGFCGESLWPYDESKFTVQPSQQCYQSALVNRIINYAAVAQQIDQMKGTIVSGLPFMFGFDVFQQIESDQAAENGIVADPSPGDSPIGGHDVTFCGYSDVQMPGVMPGNIWPAAHFKFRNHWMNSPSRPWGDGGFGYASYNYALGSHASDFWVINAIPGAAPPNPGPVVPPGPVPPSPPIPPATFTFDQVMYALRAANAWRPIRHAQLVTVQNFVDAQGIGDLPFGQAMEMLAVALPTWAPELAWMLQEGNRWIATGSV